MASAPAQLLRSLAQLHLLEPAQAEVLSRSLVGQDLAPHALARLLLDRGWLTAYQANQWLQGRGQELLLGSYVLLEKLGEGGMGAVFKARNWKLGQTVTLKLIRSERVGSADHVRRFQREIRAAAQLDHPNIVRAFDADGVHGSFALVMEYVDGIDLARLVRQHGPPPVALACEYVRQAALGLQHAFERGLVHRDIKPGNLLLCRLAGAAGSTAAGVVKVLDMGLARLEQPPAGEGSGTLTVEGTIVGTPDYISPEQARQAHQADIRSDLYSLGCSFYFLLTGRPPFTGGSLTEKLLRHQLETPRPIEQLRPDVPEAVAAVVRRLLAKEPEERYQTPAELAEHLQALLEEGVAPTECVQVRPGLAEPLEQTEEIQGDSTFWADIVAGRNQQTLTLPGIRRQSRWRWFVGAVGAVATLGIALVWLLPGRPEPKELPSREAPEEAATTKPPGQRPGPPVELKPSTVWSGPGPRVRWVSFPPDGKAALSGSAEPGVRLQDPVNGQGRLILAQHGRGLGVAPTAEGRLVVGVLEAGGSLGFVDLAGEKWIACPALTGPWQPLFNGEDLEGWSKNFDPDMTLSCQVVETDGGPAIRIEGRGTVKRKELLNNYQLRLEFKWTEPGKETSGHLHHHMIPGGYTSLAFTSTGQGRWASYGHNRRADEAEWQQGKLIGRNQATSLTKLPQGMQKPAGQWNVLEVVCWEATALYRLNGVQQFAVVNLRRERAGVEEPVTSGTIGFGSAGKGFLCRRIQMRSITEIPPEPRQ